MKKLYGVMGDPIAHSMSPFMHNDAFSTLGIEAYYHPFHVKPDDLQAAVKGMKAISVQGFNVTIPHKTAIIPLLDEVDPLAAAIGAVNTVVRSGDRFIGYNTDGLGYVQALKEDYGEHINTKSILLIGAGGAARAIYYTLSAEHTGRIDLCNRTIEKAEVIKQECPFLVETSVLSIAEAESQLAQYDIIIHTTSVGMSPKMDSMPIALDELKNGAFVSDIIYNPLETKLLKEAKARGARIQNGLKMFVYQGALAFEEWTGIFPNTEKMEQIVLRQLGGTYVNR